MPPFAPGPTQNLTLAATSASLTVDSDAPSVRVVLSSASANALGFVRVGTGAQTATTSDFPVTANWPVIIMKGVGANTVAAIANTAGVGGVLYVTTGVGGT